MHDPNQSAKARTAVLSCREGHAHAAMIASTACLQHQSCGTFLIGEADSKIRLDGPDDQRLGSI